MRLSSTLLPLNNEILRVSCGENRQRQDETNWMIISTMECCVLAVIRRETILMFFEYWRGNAKVYLTLARIFFDICSTPSISVEPKRGLVGLPLKWSSSDRRAKLTTTDLRNAWKADIIEAIECLHSWMKKDNKRFQAKCKGWRRRYCLK